MIVKDTELLKVRKGGKQREWPPAKRFSPKAHENRKFRLLVGIILLFL